MLRSVSRLTTATVAVAGSSWLLSQSRTKTVAANSAEPHQHIQHPHAMNPLPIEQPAPGKQFVPKLLQVVHRHGARCPISLMAGQSQADFDALWEGKCSDLHDKPIKCKPGALTDVGKTQLQLLGERLREHYAGFLPSVFDPALVTVRSTNMERTIASTSNMLRTLFPGLTQEQITAVLKVRPSHEDEILYPEPAKCPRLRELLWENKTSREYLAHANQPALLDAKALVAERAGRTPNQVGSWIELIDPIKCAHAHSLPLPAHWHELMDQADAAAGFQFTLIMRGRELTRLGIGRFLGELLGNMENSISPKPGAPNPRLIVYSGHDTTILPLLHAFGLHGKTWPPFASYMVFELVEEVDDPKAGASDSASSKPADKSKATAAGKQTVAAASNSNSSSNAKPNRQFVRLVYNDRVRASVPYEEFVKHVKPLVPSEAEYRAECQRTVRPIDQIPQHRW